MNSINTLSHSVTLRDRQQLDLSGVTEVERFDDGIVVVRTEHGKLTVKGSGMKVVTLDIDSADKCLRLEGKINSLEYSGAGRSKNETIASRLFG